MEAARKRPELTGLTTTFLPAVPQVYVKVDRDKVLKQGVAINDVYQTLQTFMGGLFVNYFNRFGRQWQVYVQAEGEYRTRAEDLGQFYVRNSAGAAVPLSALTTVESRLGPEFTMRYNLYRSAQINTAAAPGYSTVQAMEALEAGLRADHAARDGLRLSRHVVPGERRPEGVPPAAIFALSLLFVFLILAALYESWSLPFSVLLVHADRGVRRVRAAVGAADGEQRLRADRPDHAHRPRRQERDPDRRVRQDAVRARPAARRGRARRRAAAAAADPDDQLRLHARLPAAGLRRRRRRRGPARHGQLHHRRHARREPHRHLPHPRHVLRRRESARRASTRSAKPGEEKKAGRGRSSPAIGTTQ